MTTGSVRDFWDSQPCDSVFGEDWTQIRSRRFSINPHIPEWAEFDCWEGKRILEIGCGVGTDSIAFAERGAHVTATDIPAVSIGQARTHAETAGVDSRIDFIVADSQRLDEYLDPQPFDLVYSCGVLHRMPEPERPGGIFKLLVYYRYSWVPLALLLRRGKGAFWRLDEIVTRYAEQQDGCPITKIYSRREVKKLLNGFHVTDASARWIYPYRDFDGTRKTWYFRPIPDSVLRRLEPFLGWHLCVTATPDGI